MPLLIMFGLGAGLIGAVGAGLAFGGSVWAIVLGYILGGSLGVGAAGAYLARQAISRRKAEAAEKAATASEDDRLERI